MIIALILVERFAALSFYTAKDDDEMSMAHIISVVTTESETIKMSQATSEFESSSETEYTSEVIVEESVKIWIPEEKYNYDENVVLPILNPSVFEVLVNKYNQLSEAYVPEDLVVPDVEFSFLGDNPKKYLRRVAAIALEEMFSDASKEGYQIFAVSGYRSYEKQASLYTGYVNQYGKESADTFSAQPGKSEHQTGLVMDVSSATVGYDLVAEFGDSDEGIWLKNNAYKFGFILRYPKGKSDITGYMYEPWHFRYVGVELALEIYESELTLEEYFELYQ